MNRLVKTRRPAAEDTSVSGTQEHGLLPFESIDLMYLYTVLRVNARLIVATMLACMVGMYIYLQFVPPVYTSYAQVILDTREERVTPAQEVVSNLNVTNSVIAGEIITIRSNVLIGQVVDRLNLLETPEFNPRQPRSESLFSKLKRTLRGGEPAHVVASRLPEETLRTWVIDAVRRDLSVAQIGVSYAIGISFENTNPKLTAAITNAVAEQYIDSQLDAKMQATMRANAWLADRLLELSQQVETADAEVVDFKAEMIDIAGGNEDNINQLLAELNTKLVGSSTDRADAEVRLSQVEALLASGGLASVSDVVSSPLLETLQRQRAELAASKAQLASTLGRKHPDMVRITAQIADVDRSIETELRRRVEEMRGEVSVTRNRETALREQIDVVSERADSLSKASVRLSQLERTADATRLVYENFLSRYKETSAQADFQTPEARVIGNATVPVVPSGPRKTVFLLAAMVFGLSAAIVFVFLRNLTKAPITTADELRAVTKLPTIAVLPHVRKFGNKTKWLREELELGGRSAFLERVRTIRTSLFDVSNGSQPKVIMVTSSVPNEGKTSLCCSLAKVLNQPKKSVLLIDADLRRPDVRKALGMQQEDSCLVGYLEKRVKLKDLVVHSELLDADVIGPTVPAENAADLLSSSLFEGLLTRMVSRYDVIVVNAPPVLHLADSVLLANQADATLFTVKSGTTPSKVVRNSIRRLESHGANLVGTVLTMVRRSDAAAREVEMYKYEY